MPVYMAFIGYSIQAFINISVIDVAPYYFIIIGLILSESGENNSIKLKGRRLNNKVKLKYNLIKK